MSSFIVSHECMNNIINGLFWNVDFKNRHRHILVDAGYKESKDFKKLAKELYNLNYDAVDGRYDEKNERESVKSFEWVDKDVDKFQVLKSMHCLRYQCSEGNVPETKLYKLLSELIEAWESFIIHSMPEYESAEWG